MGPTTSVLVGLPTYDGTRYNGLALVRLVRSLPPDIRVNFVEIKSSLLAYGFNGLWATALNLRSDPQVLVTHFLLWHADIVPSAPQNWLEVLLSEQEKAGADVLSVIVPIKSDYGLTSTAVDTNGWEPRRYTLTEVHAKPESTWTEPGLLVNTGLMLVDFRKPWVEDVCFTVGDSIQQDAPGHWKAFTQPEDWNFSRDCHLRGVSVYATKAISVDHIGGCKYSSHEVWGYESDAAYKAARVTNPKAGL